MARPRLGQRSRVRAAGEIYGRSVSNLGPARARPAGRRESLSPARQDVLDLVVDADGGMTVAEVAKATGAHPNTVREHLEALVHSGYLARAQLPAVGRGRPPMIYRALPGARPAGPEYRILADLLIEHLREHAPESEVRAAHSCAVGEDWVRQRRAGTASVVFDAPGAVPNPTAMPLRSGPDGLTLRFERCPVLDLARRHPEVVCSVHLGLLRGALGGTLDVDAIELQPFAEPGACILRLPPFEELPAAAFEFLSGMAVAPVETKESESEASDGGPSDDEDVGAVVVRERVDA